MKTLLQTSLRNVIMRTLASHHSVLLYRTFFSFGFAVLIILAGALTSCSAAKVYSESSPDARYGAYRTFALVDEPHRVPKQSRASIDIMEANIEQALEREMERRGYVADEKQPDLLVKYSIAVDRDTKLVSQPVYRSRPVVAVGGFWRPRYYVSSTPVLVGTRTRAVTHKEGVLVIDVIERATGKTVWHGWSEEPIATNADVVRVLSDNVRDIMNAYPIAAR